jgi:LacI family transcriptional regulator
MGFMRRISRIPHVAVCVDKSRGYGRGILRGIARYVETFGRWSLYIDPHSAGTYPGNWLRNWKGDGILAYIETAPLARRFLRSGIPTVELFGHRLDMPVPQVCNDEEAIGRLAAEHLLERRFRRFAFSGYAGEDWVDRRFAGFARTIAGRGVSCDRYSCDHADDSPSRWERTQERLMKWLRSLPKPMGLMACSDRHAQRLLDACHRAGIPVPEELAVIGVDNDEETCRLSDPPLSSVVDDPVRIGYEAARLLDRLISGRLKARGLAPVLVAPLGVDARRSTDVTAVEDRLVSQAMRTIRRSACEGLRVEDLIGEAHVSRSVFYRRFRAALGRTPHEELLRAKLDRARDLLVQTKLTVEEISTLAGFEHSEYLSVAFKRETGVTPGAYRGRHLQPPTSGR